MSGRPTVLTQVDLDLLRAISTERTVVGACARVGVSRDVGTYRLRRMTRGLGRPIVVGHRGGRDAGTTRLTAAGRRLLEDGVPGGPVRPGSVVAHRAAPPTFGGRWHALPAPWVGVGETLRLFVTFAAEEGALVRVSVPPDAVLLARRRFPASARNVLSGVVRRVRSTGPGTGSAQRIVEVDVGGLTLGAALTPDAIRQLGVRPGRRLVAYIKASAVRRR